jgi:hypothetical protein
MGGGRVLEHGPRERLARDRRSYFHRLLHAQTEPPQAEPPQTEPLTEPRKELA